MSIFDMKTITKLKGKNRHDRFRDQLRWSSDHERAQCPDGRQRQLGALDARNVRRTHY